MNELSITREVDPNKWDGFVCRHPQGSIYHLSLWQQVVERRFKHLHGKHITATNPATKNIIAGLPVYKVKSWLLGNRLVSAPFALVCEPLAANAAVLKQLLARAIQACEQQLDYVEIRSVGHLCPDAAKALCRLGKTPDA